MNDELITKIKERGYWRVNFRPLELEHLQLSQCRELVQKNSVELRGWPYPFAKDYVRDDAGGVEALDNYYRGWIDSLSREFWHMYQSGQFLHYFALFEDWAEGLRAQSIPKREDGPWLNFVGSVEYFITEIYEFLNRLTQDGLYQHGVEVNISLHNAKGRKLFSQDRHFSYTRQSASETVTWNRQYTDIEDFQSNYKPYAREAMRHILERFNWSDVSEGEVLIPDQETLYSYKRQV